MAIDKTAKFINYYIDDGTGLISCIHWLGIEEQERINFTIGTLATIHGRISDYMNSRIITITSIIQEDDPLMEAVRWLETIHYQKSIQDFTMPLDLPEMYQNTTYSHLNIHPQLKMVDYENALSNYHTESSLIQWIKSWTSDLEYFTFNQVMQVFDSMAARVFECQHDTTNVSSSRKIALFRRCILELTNQGCIYLISEENDQYQVITDMMLDDQIKILLKSETDELEISKILMEKWNVSIAKTRERCRFINL